MPVKITASVFFSVHGDRKFLRDIVANPIQKHGVTSHLQIHSVQSLKLESSSYYNVEIKLFSRGQSAASDQVPSIHLHLSLLYPKVSPRAPCGNMIHLVCYIHHRPLTETNFWNASEMVNRAIKASFKLILKFTL